jgi:hypothetical protein
MMLTDRIWAYLCRHARFARARTLKYRNCFGGGLKLADLDIIVDSAKEGDEIDGSIPNKWFIVGLIKLCRQQ